MIETLAWALPSFRRASFSLHVLPCGQLLMVVDRYTVDFRPTKDNKYIAGLLT